MAKLSKRMKALEGKIQGGKNYPLDEALNLVKQTASAKFDESVDVAVNLGIDAKKSEQNVRGSAVLPRGTGKTVRVAVFAEGAAAEAAKKAGADIVGFQDLADQIKAGVMDFDVVAASPDAMRVVGQLGQILGPRGLMPNPKSGYGDPERGQGGGKRQGRSGAVPHRQGRHRALHHRQGVVRCGCAQGKPGGAHGGPAQGQARDREGHLYKETDSVHDHGSGSCGGCGVARGRVNQVARKTRTASPLPDPGGNEGGAGVLRPLPIPLPLARERGSRKMIL